MNLCNDAHDEVCFEGRRCPVCEAKYEKDVEIDALQSKISNLEDEVGNLEGQLNAKES